MERITEKRLRGAMGAMARVIGAPEGAVWTRNEAGQNRATVGALVLNTWSLANGIAWGVAQITSESGGERTILRARTARELWEAIYAWRAGYDYAKRSAR